MEISYKQFNSSKFKNELKKVLAKENIDSCAKFDENFWIATHHFQENHWELMRHHIYLKFNRKPQWRGLIRKRFTLKKRADHSLKIYKKQKSCCSRLYKNEKKNFFRSLNPSFVKDNNLFWKTVKPFSSNNGNFGLNIKLVENN